MKVNFGSRSFTVPPVEQKEKKSDAFDSARERVKDWISRQFQDANPRLGQQPATLENLSRTFSDLFSIYLPQDLQPGEVSKKCGEAAIVSLSLAAPELVEKGLTIPGPMAGEILSNLVPQKEEDIQAASELTRIPVSERFPKSQLPLRPKAEVSLEEIAGASLLNPLEAPYIIISLLSSLPLNALKKNPLLLFDKKDETGLSVIDKLEAILRQDGLSKTTIPSIRNLVARTLARELAPELSSLDLEKTMGRYQIGSQTQLLLGEIAAGLREIEKQNSWSGIRKARAGKASLSQAKFPPYFQYQKEPPVPSLRTKVTDWLKYLSLKSGVCRLETRGEEIRINDRLSSFVSQKISQPLLSFLGNTSAGKTVARSWQSVGQASTNVFWSLGENGLKQTAKKGFSILTTKLAGTKIGAAVGTVVPVIGNAAGAAIGFAVDLGRNILGKTLGKARGFFKNLSPFGGEKTQRVATGFNDFIQELTSGGIGINNRVFQFAFAGFFIVFFVLSWFFNVAPLRAFLGMAFPSETRFRGPLEQLPGRIPLKSKSLDTIFAEVAQKYCLPKAMLLAISQIEAPQVWNYSQEEVDQFIKAGWWEKSGCRMGEKVPGDCALGYCYDTCRVYPELGCSAYSVVGPMQFELGTWNGYIDRLRNDLGREPHRCNLEDSVFAAGLKIKQNSGTGPNDCTNWSEATVRQAARSYCGSCGVEAECGDNPTPECEAQNRPCGVNYCEAVWKLYNEYQ